MDSGLESAIPDQVLKAWMRLQVLTLGGSPIHPGPGAGINMDLLPPTLTTLDLRASGLAGQIPRSLSSLNALVELGLSYNQLSGVLPEEFSALRSLKVLNLENVAGDNPLSGELPLTWAALTNLQTLKIGGKESSCAVNGTIPPAWSALKSLENIELSYCQLSGKSHPREQQ